MEQDNSIGVLLTHILNVELTYQYVTLRGTRPTEPDVLKSDVHKALKARKLSYDTDNLAAVGDITLAQLKERGDAWLHEEYRP